MAWIKLHTGTIRHPKVAQLSHLEFRIWVSSLLYASDYRTDGWVPKGALRALVPGSKRPQKAAQALVDAGLWEETDGDGWQIHDYTDHQRTSDQIRDDENNAGGGPSRARASAGTRAAPRGHTRSRGRAGAQPCAGEDVDVDVDVEEVPPLPPTGGRTRDKLAYEGKLAAFSARHFPGVDVNYIAHYADILRRQHHEPTVEALRPLVEPYRAKLL